MEGMFYQFINKLRDVLLIDAVRGDSSLFKFLNRNRRCLVYPGVKCRLNMQQNEIKLS